ncbi:MAG: hypothetical protein ABJ308_14370 [Halieaceae bacterium]
MKATIRAGFMVLALGLLSACVNSPLGAGAQVNIYTWDNRVVPFYSTQTYQDQSFAGFFDGAILLGDIMQRREGLDIRPDTPYLLEVCNDAALCYYLVLFPGDFLRTASGAVAGYAVVTEVSTAIYYQIMNLDAAYVRAAVDEIAADVISDDLSEDERLDYSDILRLDHFDRKSRERQVRDPGIIEKLREKLLAGDDKPISEVIPILLEDSDLPLELFDPACLETPDSAECAPPQADDLCRFNPDDDDCGRIPADHCLLFPDQAHCEELAGTAYCLENPEEALCRGLRLDELCLQAPDESVCKRPGDPAHCAEFPKDPFCGGFPEFEECIERPLNPLCGKAFFDEFCAMAPDKEICRKPPVDEICLINQESEFCHPEEDKEDGEFCDLNPEHAECLEEEEESEFCLLNAEHPECLPPVGEAPPPPPGE